MLPEGVPYTEEQLHEMIGLYDELKQQFVQHREYAQVLLTRLNNGDQLNAKEVQDLSLFVKVSETLSGLEELIIGELSANIIGICEEARMRAKEGDIAWIAKWERMQPIYRAYMEIYTQRGSSGN